eukprot:TRINITY_DN13322_c0_g1_i1.p1 TRINITY_DN13322_c0_g1~~TRINITY_DN13322_c0_g1_i1.p1  ORF type:complete len:138 (+),score=24.46 TRINITY_DN13322_c0_g1_i1:33-416(+)
MYALLGLSFAFSLTFSFSELLSIGPCDRCCHSDSQSNPIFGSPRQVFALFAVALILGLIFGILFGVTNVESDDIEHSNLERNTLYCVPIGVVVGGLFGLINQWYRGRQGYEKIEEQAAAEAREDSKF